MNDALTGLDETLNTVKVMVYVNGVLVDEHTNEAVPAYAVNHVTYAAIVQVEDPDLEAARDSLEARED